MNIPDPNVLKPFLSVIEGRSPREKLHGNVGQAKNAVGFGFTSGARGGEVYEWQTSAREGGQWVLLYTVEPGTLHHDLPWNRKGYRRWVAIEERLTSKRRRVYVLADTEEEARKLLREHTFNAGMGEWEEDEPSDMVYGVSPA